MNAKMLVKVLILEYPLSLRDYKQAKLYRFNYVIIMFSKNDSNNI